MDDGPNFFANGDGQFIYPGPTGPISTTRLVAIREGLQDAELLRMLPSSIMIEMVEKVVRNATDFESDVEVMEGVRRDAGSMVEKLMNK